MWGSFISSSSIGLNSLLGSFVNSPLSSKENLSQLNEEGRSSLSAPVLRSF